MKAPSEMMSDKYCGPSKVIPLGQIRNEDGFRFIGIDRDGGEHYCIVRRGDSNSFYMSSNTALFSDLIGWIPDTQAPNVQGNRRMTAALSPAGVRLTAGFGVDCQTCGACCAYSFDWPELGEEPDGENIPLEMLDCEHGRMRCDGDRCCALEGDIGVAVRCVIYSNRPAVCREFAQEERFDDCNKVRAWHGLPPLTPNVELTGTKQRAGKPE